MGGKHRVPKPPKDHQDSDHGNSKGHASQTPSDSPNTALNSKPGFFERVEDGVKGLFDDITGNNQPPQPFSVGHVDPTNFDGWLSHAIPVENDGTVVPEYEDYLADTAAQSAGESWSNWSIEHGVSSATGSNVIEQGQGGPTNEPGFFDRVWQETTGLITHASESVADAGHSASSHIGNFIDDIEDIPGKVGSAFSNLPEKISTDFDDVTQKVQNVWGDITKPLHGFTTDLKNDIKEVAICGAIIVGILWVSTKKQRAAAVDYGMKIGKRSLEQFAEEAPKALPLLFV